MLIFNNKQNAQKYAANAGRPLYYIETKVKCHHDCDCGGSISISFTDDINHHTNLFRALICKKCGNAWGKKANYFEFGVLA